MELQAAISQANIKAQAQGITWFVVPFDFGYAPVSSRYLEDVNPGIRDKCVYKVRLKIKSGELIKTVIDGT